MMKSVAVALALLEGAEAFSPAGFKAAVPSRAGVARMGYETELGVIPPTGFFDPLGLSKNIDEETFAQYRTAELKHGRVAQLCVIGYVVPEFYRFPGIIAPGVPFADIPNGVAAINAIPALGWFQMVFLIGAVE